MYSRNLYGRGSGNERPFVIPSNYRGNAIEEKSAVQEPDEEINENINRSGNNREKIRMDASLGNQKNHSRINATKNESGEGVADSRAELSDATEARRGGEEKSHDHTSREKDAPADRHTGGGLFGKGQGSLLDFEDIILIGIILLLAQQEGNDDLILAIALLLLLS